mmetsp:Transcript_11737/g.25694  ORF Transcript_11737/g.25694 Transcript_11737/m.25694 type:complete len:204 (-) Transcript_11737:620-1231(-)
MTDKKFSTNSANSSKSISSQVSQIKILKDEDSLENDDECESIDIKIYNSQDFGVTTSSNLDQKDVTLDQNSSTNVKPTSTSTHQSECDGNDFNEFDIIECEHPNEYNDLEKHNNLNNSVDRSTNSKHSSKKNSANSNSQLKQEKDPSPNTIKSTNSDNVAFNSYCKDTNLSDLSATNQSNSNEINENNSTSTVTKKYSNQVCM